MVDSPVVAAGWTVPSIEPAQHETFTSSCTTAPSRSRGLARHRTRRRVITGRLIDHPASPCPARRPYCCRWTATRGRLGPDRSRPPQPSRRPSPVVQARRIQPAAGPLDRRRLAAAGLSALLPGLGQALNRRPRLALVFLIPSLVVLGVGAVLWLTQSPAELAAWVVAPSVLGTVLPLNLLLLVWRLVSMLQAYLDTRLQGPTTKFGVLGLVGL